MLHEGYWLTEFLTISSILRTAPVAYAQSFLYTETDDNDLTYFVIAQLEVLSQAVANLEDYLQRKSTEIRRVERLLGGGTRINHRQRALLSKALRDPDATYTITEHQVSHGVVYQTARTDLLGLEERALLIRSRRGNAFSFTVPIDLSTRLQADY